MQSGRLRHLSRWLGLGAIAALLLGAVPGRADEGTPATTALVAVLSPEFAHSVSEGARTTLIQRLVEGLKAARFEVLSGEDVAKRLAGDLGAASCRSADCYPTLAQKLRVAYLVTGSVNRADRNYDIILQLVRGKSGEVGAEVRERCDICGLEDAGEKMALAASSLRAKLEALMVAPARFTVRSTPPNAFVSVDGREIGQTPLEQEIPGGPHRIQVRHRGYIAAERSVVMVPEIPETIDVTLIPASDTFPYHRVGLGGIIGGVALAAAGALALAVDGAVISCGASAQDGLGHCPKVRETRLAGGLLVGFGAALGTAGGILLWMGADRGVESGASTPSTTPAAPTPAPAARFWPGFAPTRGGAALTLDLRF